MTRIRHLVRLNLAICVMRFAAPLEICFMEHHVVMERMSIIVVPLFVANYFPGLCSYGPGLYTYSNPALAYHAIVHGDGLQVQGSNCALIQCRVVTKTDSVPSPNSYAVSWEHFRSRCFLIA